MEEGLLLILYGHNMNDGSMFATLQGYLDAEYWEDHSVIRCDSLTQAREYEVMAVLRFAATTEANEAYYAERRGIYRICAACTAGRPVWYRSGCRLGPAASGAFHLRPS